MIPYFEQPAWQIGPLTIHAFGVAVAVAVWVGLVIARKRFERLGLDQVLGQRLGGWMLVGGIVGAHLFSVLFYFPHKLQNDPWLVLRVWEDISSFGGIIGGIAGAMLFFVTRARDDGRRNGIAYLDAVAFAFPASLAIGRLGCALAHDHPGSVTTFPLAISLESEAAREYIGGVYDGAGLVLPQPAASMGFHDLGLYELLFLSLVVVPLFAFWNRRTRPAGFYLVAFATLYAPVRFCLDMLRVADARYVGLTPAQWVSALTLAMLPFVAVRRRTLRLAMSGAVILATAWACTSNGDTSLADSPAAASRNAAPSDAMKIESVIRGLRPPVEIQGRTPLRWTLAERMAHYKVPGVSIAVIEGGRIAWARGFGVKEAGKPDSVIPTTLFQAASISKPVAATAMLRLVERGTLQLDTNVNSYLESWKLPDNKFTATEKVTLRRITSHTAGLTVHGFPGYTTTARMPTVVQVLDGEKPANTRPVRVDTTPGSIERYSGGGTTVMQQLLVDVTGKPFPELMRELVLGPAGMTSSTYEQPLPGSRANEAVRAHGQDGSAVAGGWHVYPEMAAAGLWTTPTDLAKWALAITDARAGRASTLLSTAMTSQMLTKQKDEVGLGPFVGGSGRNFRFGHGGANEGFHSELVMYPELGVGAAIMTNGDGGPLLIREVLRALAAEFGWAEHAAEVLQSVTLDAKTIAGLTGTYQLRVGPGIPARIEQDGDKLMLRAPQIPEQELLPKSDTSFVMSSLGWQVTFTRDSSGRATAISVSRGTGAPIEGRRTK